MSSHPTIWRCIYCRHISDKRFPAEHVIPTSFGKFENNLTLHCVCGECNNFFSGQLEMQFGRETGESLVRYRHGLRDSPVPAGSQTFIAKLTAEGPLFGLQVRITANAAKDGLGFNLIPQVGFEEEGTNICRWFTEDQLEHEFLKDVRFGSKVYFVGPNRQVWERMRTKLIELGFKLSGKQNSGVIEPETKFNTRVQWSFDTAIRRCLAKIVFNHLAYVTGENVDFLWRAEFDEVRNYIRYGTCEGENNPNLVFIDRTEAQLGFSSPAPIGGGHLIVTSWDLTNRAIISHLSIFGALGYRVILCRDYEGVWFDILKGHYFDVESRAARPARITRHMSAFLGVTGSLRA